MGLKRILQRVVDMYILMWFKNGGWFNFFSKYWKKMKPHWLNHTAKMLHLCEGCSLFMGWIFITNHSTVAHYSIQVEFPASDLLTVPQIRPSVDSHALICHSGPAEPWRSPRNPVVYLDTPWQLLCWKEARATGRQLLWQVMESYPFLEESLISQNRK